MSYLQDLTLRLSAGAGSLSESLRERQTRWILAQQKPDGGFAGREGESDPYYTGFALRALMVLDGLTEESADSAAKYLQSRLDKQETIIDLISIVYGAAVLQLVAGIDVLGTADPRWPDRLADLLESMRRDDGGYAKSAEGRAGSTYQTFLTVLCYELIDRSVPNPQQAVDFLLRHEHEEGGFLEIRVGKRAGVNPTAAAIGALKTLGALTPEIRDRTVEFLADMQSDEGGFTANTRIPMADLLSSCTGMITLTDLEATDRINRRRVCHYAQQMERPEGGFAGFAMDPSQDVEYTFYGLATLALASDPSELGESL
ncbi:Prenyltransferase and squalene oxidase repeat protein [Roseimaritima multifibrata]|uniref:Geranylgeranyl transferase type II subunit beta n=1 Tax=Roseimaritima multifibrata TaxID=1930274 RepID=A0A517MJD8_9BACT|nr:prenyltransferase/squalene oxidase repeat-containing protein [Roseimaritima multifibrata]QDS94897.1 Prenyltransferase and squalene oxidase repeat protein [Roseimaritima multifibrata]